MATALVEEKDESAEKMQKEPPEEMDKAAAAAAAACVWPPVVEAWYEHRKKMGKGMFGDVYKAWDRESKRLVAVKRLSGRTEGSLVKMGLHDLAREGMSLAVCRGHHSVVQLVATHADSSRGDGDNFLVTRYAGPVNLRRHMRFSPPRGVRSGSARCEASCGSSSPAWSACTGRALCTWTSHRRMQSSTRRGMGGCGTGSVASGCPSRRRSRRRTTSACWRCVQPLPRAGALYEVQGLRRAGRHVGARVHHGQALR
ncbi:hypothetical protein BS78_06G292300 [Paspalum vaginatum]|nr:hypothetical protein BS78_06G292300 [Paspalum vaginatum]